MFHYNTDFQQILGFINKAQFSCFVDESALEFLFLSTNHSGVRCNRNFITSSKNRIKSSFLVLWSHSSSGSFNRCAGTGWPLLCNPFLVRSFPTSSFAQDFDVISWHKSCSLPIITSQKPTTDFGLLLWRRKGKRIKLQNNLKYIAVEAQIHQKVDDTTANHTEMITLWWKPNTNYFTREMTRICIGEVSWRVLWSADCSEIDDTTVLQMPTYFHSCAAHVRKR